ncbi:unnamed protein product [Hymenolepis diminuta]|uniref:Uncharacterized protein n=1 Tax=Hymenolepis diminuta TaxID=6216 RepID=A0A564Z494_HYMDI|nr:unnamed protein product [Hymenolepis diminuta]
MAYSNSSLHAGWFATQGFSRLKCAMNPLSLFSPTRLILQEASFRIELIINGPSQGR